MCWLLKVRSCPSLFLTSKRHEAIPTEFHKVPIVEKPFKALALLDAVQAMLPEAAPLSALLRMLFMGAAAFYAAASATFRGHVG